MRQKCGDPCPGSCGVFAQCSVINHVPICSCVEGYTGDPFSNCYPKPPSRKTVLLEPDTFLTQALFTIFDPTFRTNNFRRSCNPSPCGPNADCNEGICSCLPEYRGDPNVGCRPECVLNTDCSLNQACVRNKCSDPCRGTCGQNAVCNVFNHIPMCSCSPGTSGNAFVLCSPVQGTKTPCINGGNWSLPELGKIYFE